MEQTPDVNRKQQLNGLNKSVKFRFHWLIPLLIALITFIAFLPTLNNDFVNWDDPQNLLENSNYRGLGWEQIKWMFTTFHMGLYQPLSWITYGMDYLLWGMNPFGYHLTNLILHVMNAVIFYFLARRLLGLPASVPFAKNSLRLSLSAGLAALLFSVHPLRVESVAWATERRDVLSGLFFFLTILCYLKACAKPIGKSIRRYWLATSVVVFLLSLVSKAIGISLPIILLVLDIYPLKRLGGGPGRWLGPSFRKVWLEKVPFLLFALVAGGVAFLAQHESKCMRPYEIHSVFSSLAHATFGISFYLWKTLFPFNLSPLYQLPVHFNPMARQFLLTSLAALAVTIGLVAARKRWPAGIVAWVCYLVILAPVLGIIQVGPQLVALRCTYLSCSVWAILAGAGLLFCRRRVFALCMWLAMAVVAGLCVLTWRQTRIWHDSVTLWSYTLSIDPECYLAHNDLGIALYGQGKSVEAMQHYEKALQINPAYASAHNNLGIALYAQGKVNKAIKHYKEAIRHKFDYGEAYYNLGVAEEKLGRIGEAIRYYEQALQIMPDDAEIHNKLGYALCMQGRVGKAIWRYEHALKIKPDYPEAHNNLGTALHMQGKVNEAIKHYREALRIRPNYPIASHNLKLILDAKKTK